MRNRFFNLKGKKVRFWTSLKPCFLKDDIAKIISAGDIYNIKFSRLNKETNNDMQVIEDARVIAVHNNWYELEALEDGYKFTATLGDLLTESSLKHNLMARIAKFSI